MPLTQIETYLESTPLLQGGSSRFVSTLRQNSHVRSLRKGQMLCLNKEDASHFFIVTEGWIKLFRETMDGSQAILDILPAGQVFGETSLFHENRYPFSAEAVENAQIICMPLSALKTEIEHNPKIALAMLTSMAHYRRQQEQELERRTFKNAPQRIGCFLLHLVCPQVKAGGSVIIDLPYDKTLVASRLGMQPETFSRALAKLKAETGIETKGSKIICPDLKKLLAYSCTACSSEFPCRDPASEPQKYA